MYKSNAKTREIEMQPAKFYSHECTTTETLYPRTHSCMFWKPAREEIKNTATYQYSADDGRRYTFPKLLNFHFEMTEQPFRECEGKQVPIRDSKRIEIIDGHLKLEQTLEISDNFYKVTFEWEKPFYDENSSERVLWGGVNKEKVTVYQVVNTRYFWQKESTHPYKCETTINHKHFDSLNMCFDKTLRAYLHENLSVGQYGELVTELDRLQKEDIECSVSETKCMYF